MSIAARGFEVFRLWAPTDDADESAVYTIYLKCLVRYLR